MFVYVHDKIWIDSFVVESKDFIDTNDESDMSDGIWRVEWW